MNRTLRTRKSEPTPHSFAYDATLVDPHPDAAQVDFGERNLLLGDEILGDDSAPMPLDVVLPAPETRPTTGHVGRYTLKETIGEGGMSRVSAAFDPILSRELAIKVLHLPAGMRGTLGELILNEARAVGALNHPGIVTVYDAGVSDQGPYVAMERLNGCDLRRLLAEGWRPEHERAAKTVRRVADALAYAHDKGVVHCDVKPANIFMVDRRRPKLLDFGIARATHGGGAAALRGLITGSPYYLPPEQLRGQDADPRSDIYALGVVLYELLTGVKPFEGETLQAITQAVLHAPVVPAHVANPTVPATLSRIVARAMERRPTERFASAREMSHALRQWTLREEADSPPLAFAPPGVRTSTAPVRAREPASAAFDRRQRVHRRTVMAAAIAALALVVVTATWLWPGHSTPRPTTATTSTARP